MKIYILIMTLRSASSFGEASSIATAEFVSPATCEAAGQIWAADLRKNTQPIRADFVCVAK